MNARDFVPPVLFQIAKKMRGLGSSREFDSYEQALKASSNNAYENTDLCNMIGDKTIIYKGQLKKKPGGLSSTSAFWIAAIHRYACFHPGETISILDFGGACGAHYFETRELIPANTRLNWQVVETEQMAKVANEKKLAGGELKFYTSIEDVPGPIAIVHSSSTLQYVPDPYAFTNRLIQRGAKWMFFNRMMFNEADRDFVTVQRSYLTSNGPGPLPEGYKEKIVAYPHTTMSFLKFNSLITGNQYQSEWIFEETTGSYRIGKEKISGKGMLYIRS